MVIGSILILVGIFYLGVEIRKIQNKQIETTNAIGSILAVLSNDKQSSNELRKEISTTDTKERVESKVNQLSEEAQIALVEIHKKHYKTASNKSTESKDSTDGESSNDSGNKKGKGELVIEKDNDYADAF